MDVNRGVTFAAIALNVCELVTNLPDEVEIIWMHPGRFTLMKGLFLFTRYYAFVVQLQAAYYADKFQNLDTSLPPVPGLELWVLYRFFAWQCFISIIDFLLMKRICLLYNRKRWIFSFISCIFICRFTLAISTASLGSSILRNTIQAKAAMPRLLMMNYTAGELLLQCVIMCLAFRPGCRNSTRRTPVIPQLMQIGVEPFVTLLFFVAGALTYMFGNDVGPEFLFPSGICVVSVLACRMNLSMMRAANRSTVTLKNPSNAQKS